MVEYLFLPRLRSHFRTVVHITKCLSYFLSCPFRLSVLERFHPWAAKSRVSVFSGLRSHSFFLGWAHVVSTFHRRPADLYRQAPWCCELGCKVSFRISPARALAELAGLQGPLIFFGPMCS